MSVLETQILLTMEALYLELKTAKPLKLTEWFSEKKFNQKIGRTLVKMRILTKTGNGDKTYSYKWTDLDLLPNEKNAKLVYNNIKNKKALVTSTKPIKTISVDKLYNLPDIELLKVLILKSSDNNTNKSRAMACSVLSVGADAIRKRLKEIEEFFSV